MANQPPEKTFRIGFCSASVFRNTIEPKEEGGKTRTLRTVVIQRRYRDDKEEWQSTNSFGLSELASAIRVMQLAQQYLESVEAEWSV